jgi:hypothetical protein
MTTRLDDVIVALTTMWQGLQATTLSGVQVVDGPQANADPTQEWVFVGHTGGEPVEGVEAAIGQQDLFTFARGKSETVGVDVGIVCVRGDSNVAAARQRALEIFGICESALRSDMTLGDLVMQAYVAQIMYVPTVTTTGAKVRVTFTVTYQAQF